MNLTIQINKTLSPTPKKRQNPQEEPRNNRRKQLNTKQQNQTKRLQESANHPQKTNEAYDKQTSQSTVPKAQTQYEHPAYEHEQTNEA
jgi:hypothetical protein